MTSRQDEVSGSTLNAKLASPPSLDEETLEFSEEFASEESLEEGSFYDLAASLQVQAYVI